MEKLRENESIHRVLGLFIHTNRLHMKALDREVGSIGLHRGQHMMLMTLSKNEDNEPSQAELAAKLNISPAAVTGVLQNLEKSGLIERSATDADNRRNKIYITEKGHRIISKSQKYFSETACAMFAGFSEDELNGFSAYLERLHENLSVYIKKKGESE